MVGGVDMAEKLKFKAGSRGGLPEKLFEGYEISENGIYANVGIDKIESVMQHFIVMHEEPLFFFLELPARKDEEEESAPGVVEKLHKKIYYMDGCSQEEALTVLIRSGDLLYNDGLIAFGFGGHESGDEIMFGKYNVLTIFSRTIEIYKDFFCDHDIERTDKLITAWDTFSDEHPGISEKYEVNGKTVYDIPEQFKEWGMYFAEQREAD